MPLAYVTRNFVFEAQPVNQDFKSFRDRRRYYEYADALIVCRNDLDLAELAMCTVDMTTGFDLAAPGFTVSEHRLGKWRPKVTIFRKIQPGLAPRSLPIERVIAAMWGKLGQKGRA